MKLSIRILLFSLLLQVLLHSAVAVFPLAALTNYAGKISLSAHTLRTLPIDNTSVLLTLQSTRPLSGLRLHAQVSRQFRRYPSTTNTVLVLRLHVSSGSVQWARAFPDSRFDNADVDSQGNVYLLHQSTQLISGSQTHVPVVTKLSSDGVLSYTRFFPNRASRPYRITPERIIFSNPDSLLLQARSTSPRRPNGLSAVVLDARTGGVRLVKALTPMVTTSHIGTIQGVAGIDGHACYVTAFKEEGSAEYFQRLYMHRFHINPRVSPSEPVLRRQLKTLPAAMLPGESGSVAVTMMNGLTPGRPILFVAFERIYRYRGNRTTDARHQLVVGRFDAHTLQDAPWNADMSLRGETKWPRMVYELPQPSRLQRAMELRSMDVAGLNSSIVLTLETSNIILYSRISTTYRHKLEIAGVTPTTAQTRPRQYVVQISATAQTRVQRVDSRSPSVAPRLVPSTLGPWQVPAAVDRSGRLTRLLLHRNGREPRDSTFGNMRWFIHEHSLPIAP